jgi:polysaccharide biosynthesis transport protein
MPQQAEQNYVDLHGCWLILKKHFLAATLVFGSVVGLAAFVTFQQKPVFQAEGKLLLNNESGLSSLTGLSEKVGALNTLTNSSNPLETEAEIIRSNSIVQKTIDQLKLKDKDGKTLRIRNFIKQLRVQSVRDTDVIELSYRSANPQEAAAIVNFLMSAYLENNIRTNRAEVSAARKFLSTQLPQLEKRVTEAEVALRRFKDENKVVSLEQEARVGVEKVETLTDEITRASAEVLDAKTRTLALQNQLQVTTQKAMELSNLSQSSVVQKVLVEYQKTQDELAVAMTRFTDEHPAVVNLRNKEFALRQQLEKRVVPRVNGSNSLAEKDLQIGELEQSLASQLVNSEVNTLALTNRARFLQQAFLNRQARLRDLPKLEQTQRSLERRLQIAQTTYQQVLKQLQEVEVVEQRQVGNARIVSTALLPDMPVSPKVPVNLGVGGLLGIVLSVGTAFILESLDKRLKSLEEAKQIFGYAILGSIPRLSNKAKDHSVSELATRDNPYSPVSAAFEMLMTNLAFTLSDKQLRVILVTSSTPGEGKSFVAANLAVVKAQMGGKVLLLDADMRRPRQHEIWQLHNFMGLSNVLVGQGELENTVQKAIVGLDVLTAGTIPPNPLPIVDSQRMATLIQEAAKKYNFVIIDTPPLNAAAEAQILGKFADGILLVVRPEVLESNAAKKAKTLIEQSAQRVLGMVTNCVNSKDTYSDYYSSKSYYGYSRKKGENYENSKRPGIKVG